MQVEAPILTQEKLGTLEARLPVSGTRQTKDLNRWIDSKQQAEGLIDTTVAIFTAKVQKLVTTIPEAEGVVQRSRIALEETRVAVAGDTSSVKAVIDGIRRDVLAHPDFRPPLVLVPLKRLAIRTPHPLIVVKEEALKSAEASLSRASIEVQKETDVLANATDPVIDEGYEAVQRADNNILAIYRRVAVASDSGMETFVRTIPWQAESLAAMYADEKAADPELLAIGYQSFVEFMHNRFKYPNQAAEHRMTTEAYRKIRDTRVTNSWRAYLGYRKLMEWAERGLVPQPAVPAVIDTVGERIRSFVPETTQESI